MLGAGAVLTDPEIDARLRPYLRPGERLVWTGRPKQGLMFTSADILLVPFSLLWGGFAIFWEVGVLSMPSGRWREPAMNDPGPPTDIVFPLFGAAFVVVGLFLIFGRFIVDAWLRGRTDYGLTDSRALVLRRGFGRALLSAPLGDDVEVRTRGDGRGTLRFGRSPGAFSFGGRGGPSWIPSLSSQVQFLAVENPMDVYRQINSGSR